MRFFRSLWALPVFVFACVGDSNPTGNDAGPDVTVTDAAPDVVPDVSVTCDAGLKSCNGACVDTTSDSKNCGACSAACSGAFTCSASECGNVVTQIARGSGHVCVLLHDGSVWCRGESSFMQLATTGAGDPTCQFQQGKIYSGPCTYHAAFEKVPLSGAASQLAAGGESTCAVLQSNGQIYCWGDNEYGQLGHSNSTDPTCPANSQVGCQNTPAQVLGIPDPVAHVSMGTATVCVVTTKNDVWCWGAGDDGELGDGNGVTSPTPVKPLSNATEVVVSYGNEYVGQKNRSHVCAITKSNTVMCWGDNFHSELGHLKNTGGDATCCINGDYWNNTPSQAGGLTSITPKHLALGLGYTCLLDMNGQVSCFGDDSLGVIQWPPAATDVTTPTPVIGVPNLTTLNAMATHLCGGTAGGDTWCWGDTSFGQVGSGLTIGLPGGAVSCGYHIVCVGPTKLAGIAVSDVRLAGGVTGLGGYWEAGGTLALTPDGGVIGWGQDSFSMLQEADGGEACDDAGNGHCVTTPQWLTGLPQ